MRNFCESSAALASILLGVLFISIPDSVAAAPSPRPAPPHVFKSAGPYTSPDNMALPGSQLVSQTTMAAKAASLAAKVNGVLKSVNLTTYGKDLANGHQRVQDYTVSPNRQVYVVDIALPNGINTHGGVFGPNSEVKYSFDAQTGKYISSLTSGRRIGSNVHAR